MLRAFLEFWIVQFNRQGNKSIEPIRAAFPALGCAADPGALFYIGPKFVEMSAKSARLDFELTFQPSRRLDASQGQGNRVERAQGFRCLAAPSGCQCSEK